MRKSKGLRWLALALAMLFATVLPASADIKSFNAAMGARDYKVAAAAAASVWPTLDPSRDDYAIIAREFGFAAYLAGDFAAAKTYGEAAVTASEALNEDDVSRTGSRVLARLAEHKLGPSGQTRARLHEALVARAGAPDLDLTSYFAAEALALYDFDRGAWKDSVSSAGLAQQLSERGGSAFVVSALRFELLGRAANYLDRNSLEALRDLDALWARVVARIAEAPSDKEAESLVPVYYEVDAWHTTIEMHLEAIGRLRNVKEREKRAEAARETPAYKAALKRFRPPLPPGVCKITPVKNLPVPKYPSSALFRGMQGTVVMRLDIDEAGRVVSEPDVFVAVPVKHFAKAASDGARNFRFEKAKDFEPGCTMAQKGYVLTMVFNIL